MHDWQKEFKLKENLVELDIENIETHLLKLPRIALTNTMKASMLKGAIAAGWVEEPPSEVGEYDVEIETEDGQKKTKKEKRYFYKDQNIDEMNPGAVKWFGEQVEKAYQEATEIPKNL